MRFIALLILGWLLPSSVYGQACYLQQDCGPGMLCSESGTCQPIRNLLNTGSNTVYWVDQASGNDANNGNESQPFKTIQRAVQGNTLKAGDAVIIRKGTYYGQISPGAGGAPGNRITIAAFPGEEVVVTGVTNISGNWTAEGNVWRTAWSFPALWTRVTANDPFGPARRRDVVIANGQMLQAVYSRADVREGTFFLEGSPGNPSTLFAQLPGNANPNNASMQTSRLNHLFNPSNNEANCRFGQVKGYFHLIGITFRHTANDGQMGAVCAGSEGSLLENITAEWTNGSGFLISGKNHVVRGVRALNNGMSGIRGEYCDNCTVEYATSKYNNWKGYEPFWESGGGKWLYTTNSTFRKLDFSDNYGPGLWLDMDNFDNVIEQSRFDGNHGANLFLEWTTDRTIVRNNVFSRAKYAGGTFYGHGVLIHAANNNMLLYNTFMGNEGGGMRIRADGRDKALGNRYYNNLFLINHKLAWGTPQRSSEISFEEHTNDADARTNKGDGNIFWYRNYAVQEFHTFQYRPKTASGNAVKASTLGPWQSAAQTDYNSGITNLSQPHVRDTTNFTDGWRLPDNSQYLGKAVALPGDIPVVMNDFDGDARPASGGSVGADQPFGTGAGGGDAGAGGGGDNGNGGGDNGGGDNGNGDNGNGGGDDGGSDNGGDGTDGTGGGDGSGIARVQFITMDVEHMDNNVAVTWEAANEYDVDSYVLERSTDGENYTRLGSIEKVPDESASQRYEFNDGDLPNASKTLFYRIKNVYLDRSVTYSEVATVLLGVPEAAGIHQNYPNPANGITRIVYDLPSPAGVSIKLYNALGQEVKTLVDIGKPAGHHILLLDTSTLSSGIYYYRFEANGMIQSRTMTVIR